MGDGLQPGPGRCARVLAEDDSHEADAHQHDPVADRRLPDQTDEPDPGCQQDLRAPHWRHEETCMHKRQGLCTVLCLLQIQTIAPKTRKFPEEQEG